MRIARETPVKRQPVSPELIYRLLHTIFFSLQEKAGLVLQAGSWELDCILRFCLQLHITRSKKSRPLPALHE